MLENGTVVAGYRIEGLLGHGGMGSVYRATQLSLGRTVALKVLASQLGADEHFRQRFRREGLVQAAMEHPNIVTVFEAGETEQHELFLAMQLVTGQNLKELVRAGVLHPQRTIAILRPVADALDVAHAAGLIHRDIKPQNILVGARDRAYLADFGLTRAIGDQGLTRTGQFLGTCAYIAPEQALGQTVSGLSDVYSLAAVLFECLAGEEPYARDSEPALLLAHIHDPPPRITERRRELSEDLDDVIGRGMAKRPDERYPRASELILAAERALQPTRPAGPRPTRITPRRAPAPEPEEGHVAGERQTTAGARPAGVLTVVGGDPDPGGDDTAAAATAQAAADVTPLEPPQASAVARPPAPAPAEADAGAAATRSWTSRPALRLAALVVPLAVGAGLLGLALAGSSPPERSSEGASRQVRTGPIALTYPGSWSSQPPIEVPGLDLGGATAVAPDGGDQDQQLFAGRLEATGPGLLPSAFVDRLDETPARDDPVQLGDVEAYRYAGLRPEGMSGRLTLYVAPTSEGVATVGCHAPEDAAGGFMADCERLASSLRLATDTRAFPLGPSDEYASRVRSAMRTLNQRRGPARRELAGARTPARQAAAAASLARLTRAAAADVDPSGEDPAVQEPGGTLATSLRRTASAYDRLAAAARRSDRAGYREARADVRRSEAAVQESLDAFEPLGYSSG